MVIFNPNSSLSRCTFGVQKKKLELKNQLIYTHYRINTEEFNLEHSNLKTFQTASSLKIHLLFIAKKKKKETIFGLSILIFANIFLCCWVKSGISWP